MILISCICLHTFVNQSTKKKQQQTNKQKAHYLAANSVYCIVATPLLIGSSSLCSWNELSNTLTGTL